MIKHPKGYEHIRRVILKPWKANVQFILDMWDGCSGPNAMFNVSRPQHPIAYRLRMVGDLCPKCGGIGIWYDKNKPAADPEALWKGGWRKCRRKHTRQDVTLFMGADFGCSPLVAIDSDACVSGVMSMLTLRPGDTDADYFEDYTAEQLAYCTHHAESLGCAAMDRFGEG